MEEDGRGEELVGVRRSDSENGTEIHWLRHRSVRAGGAESRSQEIAKS